MNVRASEPAIRGARRRRSASRALGVPHRRIEEWKYSDLSARSAMPTR